MDYQTNMTGDGFYAFGTDTGKFYILAMIGGNIKKTLIQKYQDTLNVS
jgi:hypothetical protein